VASSTRLNPDRSIDRAPDQLRGPVHTEPSTRPDPNRSIPAPIADRDGLPTDVDRPEAAARLILEEHIRRIAVGGRLRVSADKAADLVHAAGCGTVPTLLALAAEGRDSGLSEAAREAAMAAVTAESPALDSPGPSAAAIALCAILPDALGGLTRRPLSRLCRLVRIVG
jgi:hypothetical protein